MPPSSQPATKEGSQDKAASRVTLSDLQPDAPDTYTVQKGDTLWGIAGRFLKDPWKWPQIWEMNRDEIKNPHRIYPGNVIRLDRGGDGPRLSITGGTGEADAVANVVKVEPRVRVDALETAIPSIPASAIVPFLTQPLVVDSNGLDNAPLIVAAEESRVILGSGDTAYADRIGTNTGINWQVYRQGTALKDPESGEILGYEAKYVGDARVRRYGNPTTLTITKARQEINRGDRLVPTSDTTLPNFVPHAPDKMIRGTIMSVEDGVSELGQYQIVALNRGKRDGIEPGHVLVSYRRGEVVSSLGQGRGSYFDMGIFKGLDLKPNPVVPDPPRRVDPGTAGSGAVLEGSSSIQLPNERNGLLFIFRVFDRLSYAMVMKVTRPIYVGDVVQTP